MPGVMLRVFRYFCTPLYSGWIITPSMPRTGAFIRIQVPASIEVGPLVMHRLPFM